MLKQRLSAAKQVAERLHALEDAIDLALARAGELTTAMPSARADAGLSGVVGQEAIANATKGLVALVDARQAIIEAHQSLAETRDQMGLKTYGMGSLDKLIPSAIEATPVVALVASNQKIA